MKNIIVVSGASSGMGKEFILQILEKEPQIDEIWAIARREDRLLKMQKEVSNKIVPLALDLTNEKDLLKYKDKLAMIDYTLPYMKENSKIMNICSCAGFQPIPYINDYAATKSYLLSYSRALNKELKYRNIHVLAVTPYWTKTEFFDRAIDDNKKKVVINYNAMYDPEDVMRLAIKDLYKQNKDISCYGFVNRFQKVLTKVLPHKLVMKVWMNQQKLDGTPDIRK